MKIKRHFDAIILPFNALIKRNKEAKTVSDDMKSASTNIKACTEERISEERTAIAMYDEYDTASQAMEKRFAKDFYCTWR